MINATDLEFYIQHRKEERYLEYKRSMIWTGDHTTKVKVAKAMMAMSNLRNGGVIVIGMQEIQKGVWEPDNMTLEQVNSFNHDDIAQWVNDYTVPAVQFSVEPLTLDSNKFVIIMVSEFDMTPSVCRKQKTLGGIEVLKSGAIYYRSNRKNESAPISSEEDMRELIQLAVYKGVAGEVRRLHELGLIATDSDLQKRIMPKFEEEREGL
jgi:predicted HTH transcriptional regulator